MQCLVLAAAAGLPPQAPPPGSPEGVLDMLNSKGTTCALSGWCSGPKYSGPGLSVRVRFDGPTVVANGTASIHRKVAGDHGFQVPVECAAFASGSHRFDVECYYEGGGAKGKWFELKKSPLCITDLATTACCNTPFSSPCSLPGTPLRDLASARGLLFGTDIMDSPFPKRDAGYASIAQGQFDFANWDFSDQWSSQQRNGPEDAYNFAHMDALVPFMAAANMTARTNAIMPSAHILQEPVGSGAPQWLIDGYNNHSFTPEQLQGFLKRHIDTVVPHWLGYPSVPMTGLITVNEALWNQDMGGTYGAWPASWVFGPSDNLWAGAFNGSGDPLLWFKKTFEWTRQAVDAAGFNRSQVRLFYNDYSIEVANAKADAVYRLLKEMLAAGVPIDGIGFQAHMQCDCNGYPAQPGCNDPAVIGANFQRFIDLGLSVWVTELDVRMAAGCTEQMQADVYGSVLQACLDKAPHCDAFMLWGFTDNYNWLSAKTPCILDKEYNPKPAFFTLQEKLANVTRAGV